MNDEDTFVFCYPVYFLLDPSPPVSFVSRPLLDGTGRFAGALDSVCQGGRSERIWLAKVARLLVSKSDDTCVRPRSHTSRVGMAKAEIRFVV